MHMADALVSPAVAGVAGAAALTLLVVASRKVGRSEKENIVPLMGVMGAFVFAAQMINFSIPGTGSSGHIIGGILLAALMGPWAGYLTLASVLVVQALVFADGGLMALGCNLLNMGVCSTLIAYPLIYRPIVGKSLKMWRMTVAAIVSSVVGLELGAMLVTLETELSGVTALDAGSFLALMTSIHFFIGIGEGVATAAVLYFVKSYKPSLLIDYRETRGAGTGGYRHAAIVFILIAVLLAGVFTWIASDNPDGLEWSIGKLVGDASLTSHVQGVAAAFKNVQNTTSVLPEYDSTWSGIIGCTIVIALVWSICSLITRRHKSTISVTTNNDSTRKGII